MQPIMARALAIALLLCALGAQAARQAARVGEAFAREWLKDHGAPQEDQLAELKTANPEAYAIVKALLTKRSLGLLNPKHPSASFAAPPPGKADEADDAASGPAAFQALASSGSSVSTAAVYPEAPAAAPHRDWLNWKPKQSATDDEAMVSNVLGAVADLKSSSNGRPHTKSLLGKVPPASAEATTPEAPAEAAQAQPSSHENSYLKGLDLGGEADAGTPKPKANLRHDSTDYLASFSWDDEAARHAAVAPHVAATSAPELGEAAAAPTQAPQHKDALLSWLGGSPQDAAAKRPAQPRPAQASEQPRSNPYMSYLH